MQESIGKLLNRIPASKHLIRSRFTRSIWLSRGFVLWVGCLAGCTPQTKTTTDQTSTPRTDVELQLVVVDDPAMAEAIDSLRSEWKARTGASVTVRQLSIAEATAAEAPMGPADAIIYPSYLLGHLAERDFIGPLPPSYAQNQELAWSDTFELLQLVETQWAQAPYAVPFGSPVLTCFYRPDLLERIHRRPPETWTQYQELAQLLNDRKNLGDAAPPDDAPWFGAAEPLAPGWAGRVFLARAAAYAKHRDHYSTLFNIETMEPLIAGPPFVRALEELAAAAKLGPPNARELDPAAARREFLAGHCALALSWPGHASATPAEPTDKTPAVAFIELPGSTKVYDIVSKLWDNRDANESVRVPLLGMAGRLGSITRQSAHAENALQLLSWLSGQEWAAKVSAASPATTLYRRSQLRTPRPWVDSNMDASAAQQYAVTVRDALNRTAYLTVPRFAGQERYLAALDQAVEQVLSAQKSPAEALAAAAAQWSTITQELGPDAQRKAYRKSLGLEP